MFLKIFFILVIFFNWSLLAKEKTGNKPKMTKTGVKVLPISATETKEKEEGLEGKEIPPLASPTTIEKQPVKEEEIKSGPLSEDEIIQLLKEKHRGSIVGKFMDSYPRLIKLTVRVTMDKEIRKIWKDTLNNKTRYYLFLGILLLTMAINWAWRRAQANRVGYIWEKIGGWVFRVFLINFSRLALFILLFEFELRPIWVLARRTFGF